ncbi:MAG: hypothetical protein IPJ43_10030 [Saprospiraceae bacterium]|nr:hypothetical protein [Saprospiraceae bacterium]
MLSGSGNSNYYMNYASILENNGKKQDAILIVRKALELAKSKNEPTNAIETYLLQLQS